MNNEKTSHLREDLTSYFTKLKEMLSEYERNCESVYVLKTLPIYQGSKTYTQEDVSKISLSFNAVSLAFISFNRAMASVDKMLELIQNEE